MQPSFGFLESSAVFIQLCFLTFYTTGDKKTVSSHFLVCPCEWQVTCWSFCLLGGCPGFSEIPAVLFFTVVLFLTFTVGFREKNFRVCCNIFSPVCCHFIFFVTKSFLILLGVLFCFSFVFLSIPCRLYSVPW